MDEDLDIKLVRLVEKYPVLYDKKKTDFRNLNKKNAIWRKIAIELGVDLNQICKRYKYLRQRFTRARKDRPASSEASDVDAKWELYDAMSFLTPHVEFRKSKSNMMEMEPLMRDSEETNHASPLRLSISKEESVSLEEFSPNDESLDVPEKSTSYWETSAFRERTVTTPKRTSSNNTEKIEESVNNLSRPDVKENSNVAFGNYVAQMLNEEKDKKVLAEKKQRIFSILNV